MNVKDNLVFRNIRDILKIYFSRKNSVEMKEKNIILIGSASYGNLGDQAISLAEVEFLKNRFPDYNLVEVYDIDFYGSIRNIKKQLTPDDIIFFTGGGNFGSLYRIAEDQRRVSLKQLGKSNPIIFFPQSIYYEKNSWGEKLLKYSKKLFGKYANLVLVTREKGSYQFAVKNFDNDVLLVPDIVLSLKESMEQRKINQNSKRQVIFSFRNDQERNLSLDTRSEVEKLFKQLGYSIRNYDTHIGDSKVIRDELRTIELTKIWDAFRLADIVVTDRLHGMIFAYITGTPAIVFSNNNPKIKETYCTWLEKTNRISFLEKVDLLEIEKIINEYEDSDGISKDVNLEDKFSYFESVIRELSKNNR